MRGRQGRQLTKRTRGVQPNSWACFTGYDARVEASGSFQVFAQRVMQTKGSSGSFQRFGYKRRFVL
jgi:hypothetical protein